MKISSHQLHIPARKRSIYHYDSPISSADNPVGTHKFGLDGTIMHAHLVQNLANIRRYPHEFPAGCIFAAHAHMDRCDGFGFGELPDVELVKR
jgi:hypothetical protein